MDPRKESDIVGCLECGRKCRKFPGKPLHLTVGYLHEDANTGHPGNESGIDTADRVFRRLSGQGFHLLVDEVRWEVEHPASHQAFLYILQSQVSGYGRPQRSFLVMRGRKGHSSSFLWSKDWICSIQQDFIGRMKE